MKLYAHVAAGGREWLVYHDCRYVRVIGEGWKKTLGVIALRMDPRRLP